MKKQSGFSLVELAIVLVIIGLITGGILTGQDLIRASELNSVIAEKHKFQTAVNTFKIKYNGLPGDLNNAASYWSTSANGDRDGYIEIYNEAYRAWQQLSLSGLISGNYTGTHTSNASVLETNTPASTFKPAGWGFYHNTTSWSDQSTVQNKLTIGIASASDIPLYDVFTPSEASSIDVKIDDGIPSRGKVWGGPVSVSDCSSAATSAGTYNLSLTTIQCGLLFLID